MIVDQVEGAPEGHTTVNVSSSRRYMHLEMTTDPRRSQNGKWRCFSSEETVSSL